MIDSGGLSSADVAAADSSYNEGWKGVKFGDNKDSFVENMLKYDKNYIAAQSALDSAQLSGNEASIAQAMENLQTTRVKSEDNAKKLYDNATNYYADHDEVASAAKAKYNKKANRDASTNIDYKKEKTAIANEKRRITSSDSYARAHGKKPKN